MKKIAIYARVSTSQQDTESQRNECRAHAERCGYEIVEIYEDKISGMTSKDDRPELSRLLTDAFSRKFSTIIVYSIDRLGRSLKHCLEILETLKSHRCDFVSITQNLDTSTQTGVLLFNLLAVLANYERTMILERTALGRARARANGVKFGRPSKYNESVANAVRMLRAKGAGIREIQKSLGIGAGTVYRALRSAA